MTREELIEFLKENLSIAVKEEHGLVSIKNRNWNRSPVGKGSYLRRDL